MADADPILKIYVDQLRGGKTWPLRAELAPHFLHVHEKELSFVDPVLLDGEAYLAHEELVIQVAIKTQAQVPCRVCNQLFKVPIVVEKLIQVEPIAGLKRGFFDISEILREAILLEVPGIAECHGGKCPARQEMERYLRQSSHEHFEKEEGYHPFENLTLDDE